MTQITIISVDFQHGRTGMARYRVDAGDRAASASEEDFFELRYMLAQRNGRSCRIVAVGPESVNQTPNPFFSVMVGVRDSPWLDLQSSEGRSQTNGVLRALLTVGAHVLVNAPR